MMPNFFNVRFDILTRLLIPPRLRKPRQLAWLNALVSPFNRVYQNFKRGREANLYKLKVTGQVVYLEAMLNDRYDVAQRRIRITDSITYPPVYFYTEPEQKNVPFYQDAEETPVFFFTEEEAGVQLADFWVLVPSGVVFNEQQMRADIDYFKLPTRKYKIQKV